MYDEKKIAGIYIRVSTEDQAMKDELNKNKDKLEKANKKSLELDNNSRDIKYKIDNLKQSRLNKDNYILSSDDKEKLISYIDKVDNTNKEYFNIQSLSVSLKNLDTELKNNKDQIKVLIENNKALSLRNENLTKSIKNKDNEIDSLKEENNDLKSRLNYWKNKFIKDKMFSSKECDKYFDVSVDLYEHGIIEDDTIRGIKDNERISKITEKYSIDYDRLISIIKALPLHFKNTRIFLYTYL